jgi:16S rRNA (uracil1498-N3)-methyltransferase
MPCVSCGLAVGDVLTLFSGNGGEYAAMLVRVDKRGAAVRIVAFDPVERESPLAVTLAQSVAGNDAMDYAVRKAVELGVTAVQPLITTRSAPLPAGERTEKRLAHWRQVSIAACEQCGRNRVPEIAAPQTFSVWLAAWEGSGLVLTAGAATSLAAAAQPAAPIALLVGPEGGFTEREVDAADAAGFLGVRLGARAAHRNGVTALARCRRGETAMNAGGAEVGRR